MGRRRITEGSGNDYTLGSLLTGWESFVVPLVEAVLARGIVRRCVLGVPAVGAARVIVGSGVRCHVLGSLLTGEL